MNRENSIGIPLKFLEGGGHAGHNIRLLNWSNTPLGPIENWLPCLKTTLAMVLHSSLPMMLFWGEQFICFYNDPLYEKLGKHSANPDGMGKSVTEAWPDLWRFLKPLLRSVYARKESHLPEKIELPGPVMEQPSMAHWTLNATPVKDENGTTRGVLVICNETTGQNKLKHILENTNSCFAVLKGESFIIKELNIPTHYLIHEKNLIGTPLLTVLPELKEQNLMRELRQVLQTGRAYHGYEEPINFPDKYSHHKKLSYFNIDCSPFKTEAGKILEIAILATEVTHNVLAKHEAEQKIKETKERLELISKATQDVVWDWDLLTNKLWWNEGFKTLFKYTDKEIEIGIESWYNRIHPQEKSRVIGSIHDAINSGQEEWKAEYKFRRSDGSYAMVMDRAYILHDANKRPYRMVGAMQDITEQKEAEMKLTEVSAQNLETSSRLESILKNAPVGFALFNQRHEYLHVNEALAKINGIPPEEHKGKTIQDVLPGNSKSLTEILDKVFETKAPILNLEIKGETTNAPGVERSWLTSFYPVLIEDPAEVRFVGAAVLEITDRIKAEEALRESEKQFRDFSNHIQNLAWMAHGDGWIYWYNKRWYDYTGTTREEMEGWGWTKVHHPDHVARTTDFIRKAWQKGEAWELTFPLRRRDGNYHWFLTRVHPIKDEAEKIVRWIGTNTDIHQELETQKELKQSEYRLRQVSDFMPQIVWSTDAHGYHDFFNRRWYEFTGLGYEETKGENWAKVLHPDDLERTKKVWSNCLKTGNLYQIEYRMKRHDGKYRWLLARAMPLRLADGSIGRWYGTCTDIHDQRTMADKLEELVEERTKELKRSNDDLQQFAHVASHDLREPVRKIKIFEGALRDEFSHILPAQANVYLSKIRNATNRMVSMIEGVLQYSSVEGATLNNQRIHLNTVIQDIEADLDLVISEKKATLQYKDLPVIKGTPTLIYQLFYNLINNSLKFSDPQKPLIIEMRTNTIRMNNKPFHEIIFRDNGIGFKEIYAEAIFGTFTRLNPKDRYEGTGLGLALCKKIVERHGGAIYATGAEGVGAIFTILLPADL